MVTEDDVDVETLQAQIDMSMSFAHNLVSSWIKPTHLAQLRSSNVNSTQILEEELRRPPRLGVGASIPTASPSAHEAAKLKRRLEKNATKNEGLVASQPLDSSRSDDEEHKGRPTKRKTQADPFGHESRKKKRKAESTVNPHLSAENVSKHSVSRPKNPAVGEPTKRNSFFEKAKHRMGSGDEQTHANEGQQPVTLVSSPLVKFPVQTTLPPSLNAPAVLSLLEPSRGTSVPVPGKPATPEFNRVHTNLMPIPGKPKPLGIPLLNLDGPPELTGEAGNATELNNSRKKRKRRKKKKKKTVSTGDN